MTSENAYLAFDLGAESGRAMLATLSAGKLELLEIHRFLNLPQQLPSGLHWNLLDLWVNLVQGLRKAAQVARDRGVRIVSVGVDTWGVDFGLLGASGELLGLPFAYRDPRNPPAMKAAFRKVPAKAIYQSTGIQFMPFNSVFQLVAHQQSEPRVLAQAKHMLFMPDLLHFFLSGKAVNEATIASTSQLVDPRHSATGAWDLKLARKLGLPTAVFGRIKPAGSVVGKLLPAVAAEAGLTAEEAAAIQVITPGSHDTASAVAAVPVNVRAFAGSDATWAYISSGTWSLMGAELDGPIISEATRKASFTNERGVAGKIRFLKNIAGLWLVQECRRDFARRGSEYTYAQLADMAAASPPFRTLVDPDHAPFAAPGDMPAKIAAFAKATGQPAPEEPGQYVRCCLESLAFTYRRVLKNLEAVLGRRVELLHIVGGGGQNTLLNQMTADAIGRRVVVGPYEATAIGNALTQAMGRGDVRDLDHLRQIVRDSFQPATYDPKNPGEFEARAARFEGMLGE